MRIGLYDPYSDTPTGGEKYMYTMAEYLSKSHDVDIFWNSQVDIEKVAERFSLDLSMVHRVPNIFSSKYSMQQRIAAARNYDRIIYLSDGSLPLLLKKNLIVHFQHPVEWVTNTPSVKIKFAQVRHIICNSQFTRSYIDRKFGTQSIVLYPPVGIQKEDIKKENIVLHVGRFSADELSEHDYKKQHVMVNTFKQIIDQGMRDWKLFIAASVGERDVAGFDEMKESAKGYPIEFLINESNKNLWKLYSRAKIYWHASGFGENLKLHPERAEHFGISTVEAMGAGAVPVVINAGGQKEIVTDKVNGLLWNTEEEWIEKTLSLMKNETEREVLSVSAEKRAKDFSNERFCKQLEEIIR